MLLRVDRIVLQHQQHIVIFRSVAFVQHILVQNQVVVLIIEQRVIIIYRNVCLLQPSVIWQQIAVVVIEQQQLFIQLIIQLILV